MPSSPSLPTYSPNDNAYSHPIDLLPLVDLNLGKVVRIDMQKLPPKVTRAGGAVAGGQGGEACQCSERVSGLCNPASELLPCWLCRRLLG